MRAARAHAIAANGDASLYIDTVHVVATALWWVQATGPEELPADVDPYSRAGEAFIGFAAAVQLLEACSQLQQLTDYAGEFSEGYVDEALAACAAAEEEA
jgi:hypothetical protein